MIKNIIVMSVAVIVLAGCAAQKKNIIESGVMAPAKTLDYAEAVSIINAQAGQVSAIKADIQIEIKSNLMEETKFCSGKMMLSRPDKIRVKGYQPFVPTLFDIASDGKKFWVYVPQEKKLYVGVYTEGAASPVRLDIDPLSLVSAMTFERIGVNPETESVFLEKSGGECMIAVAEKQADSSGESRFFLRRKIWVDPQTQKISKQQYFKNDGEVSFEVDYEKYSTAGETAFPQQILFVRPKTGTRVKINLLKTSFNQTFSEDIFSLDDISNVDRVEVDK